MRALIPLLVHLHRQYMLEEGDVGVADLQHQHMEVDVRLEDPGDVEEGEDVEEEEDVEQHQAEEELKKVKKRGGKRKSQAHFLIYTEVQPG